jgi:predicted secreted Zn-dependent protease
MNRVVSLLGMIGIGKNGLLAAWLATCCTATAADSIPNYTWTTNYYSVTGATPREIRMSINQSRPWKTKMGWDGYTEWQVNWRFDVQQDTDGCRVTSFTPKAVIKTTLPRWVPPPNATPEAKESWRRFSTRLAQHEAGHAGFAFSAMAEMRKIVNGLQAISCQELRKTINQLANSVVDEYRRKEKEYDVRTRHGQLQGASF